MQCAAKLKQYGRIAAGYALLLTSVAGGAQAQTQPCRSTVIGTVELVELTSRVFHNERYLRVWLPPGYADPANKDKRYPALYMMDGQTLFDGCTATGDGVSEWRIDEALTTLIAERTVPPLIVIGVDHMGVSRAHEYLPYRDIGR